MRTLNDFNRLVQESLEKHAERKGYNDSGADGENLLYQFTKHIGASGGHSMGEIIYKATEYMKEAREVLLIKIAAWAFLEWKYFKSLPEIKSIACSGNMPTSPCYCTGTDRGFREHLSFHSPTRCQV